MLRDMSGGWVSKWTPRREDRLPEVLGRCGALELRLARTPREVKQAQRLRYEVFYEEMSARPTVAAAFTRRDADAFDRHCDHLLVVDRAAAPGGRVVGTYRLLRQDAAVRAGGFYSASAFDVAALVARHRALSFLELGRSCVLKPYRDKRTVELLWQGVWAYVRAHGVDAMIGCASLEGSDPARLALPLSYLHHHHRAPDDWRGAAREGGGVAMNLLPREAVDVKAGWRALPPLVKGYLRLGAMVGDRAVVDRAFNTTDVFIAMPVAAIAARYVDYYADRRSAA